jgi:hypothetical protein
VKYYLLFAYVKVDFRSALRSHIKKSKTSKMTTNLEKKFFAFFIYMIKRETCKSIMQVEKNENQR